MRVLQVFLFKFGQLFEDFLYVRVVLKKFKMMDNLVKFGLVFVSFVLKILIMDEMFFKGKLQFVFIYIVQGKMEKIM